MTASTTPEPRTLRNGARGCLLGLAVGDALGQPTEGWTPERIAETHGYVDDLLDPSASVSDDTEYTLFSARVLLDHGPTVTSDDFADAWLAHIVPQRGSFKGAGFSEMATIDNLQRGLRPPRSGRHYHAWSDGLAMRVAPCAITAAGDPTRAAHLARIDGAVSHDGEGIHAGAAVAAAIAAALRGHDLEGIVTAAKNAIPTDSWTRRSIDTGLELGRAATTARDAIDELHEALAITDYPWPDLAPEAVGLSFGLLIAGQGDVTDSLLAAVNLGRDSDTNAAIVGAILGARHGTDAIPIRWHHVLKPAEGRCLQSVRGMNLLDVADRLADLAMGAAR